MEVYQVRLKVYLMKDVKLEDCQTEVTSLIDTVFAQDAETLEFHKGLQFKNYTFDNLYPCEPNKYYREGKIYTLTIRTIDEKLAKIFTGNLANVYTNTMKSLVSEVKILHQKQIDRIYSITPIIVKTPQGYWKSTMSLEEYQNRIRINLIKKYNQIYNTKMEESFDLFTAIDFINRKPIKTKYKGISLLGDKLQLQIAPNVQAQKLAMVAIGTGLGETNSRGYGFVNYKFL